MIWKSVPGYSDYEINEVGDVRRIRGGQKKLPFYLKKWIQRGYFHVNVFDADGRQSPRLVSRLVALAFLGDPPDNERVWVAHRNGLRRCNHHSNLYWATPKENAEDRDTHGKTIRGEKTNTAKLTEAEVLEIRVSTVDTKVLADCYGVTSQTIRHIQRLKTWKHI